MGSDVRRTGQWLRWDIIFFHFSRETQRAY